MWKNYFDPKAKIYGVDYDSVLVIEKYPNTIKLIATLMGKAG